MIIGISGKTGSGKSSVAKYIADKLGCFYIDVDILSKDIRDEYKDEIIELIEVNVVRNNEIDSKLLGDILFNNKELMKEYNAFIYSKQLIKIKDLVNKEENVVLDSMFLPVMDEIFKMLDYKILVYADDYKRMTRVIKRDNISEEYYKKRDSYSLDYKNKDFDLVINNDIDYKEQLDNWISDNIKLF